MKAGENFFNYHNHGFVRVAVGVPSMRVADPAFNAARTIELINEAASRNAVIALFPELGLAGYTSDDLFHQRALLDGSLDALTQILKASAAFPTVSVVGMPLVVDNLLLNVAVVLQRGHVLGVVPKTYLPNYREFYELRQFHPGDHALSSQIEIVGQHDVPFGSHTLFEASGVPGLTFHVEICEDVWVPIPPSSYAALAGATVLLNLSASNITVGKAGYRRELVTGQSARCLAAYLYSAAGAGESTTDLAWDGHALICENGNLLAESERYHDGSQLIASEIDLERLAQERMRQNSFGASVHHERASLTGFRRVRFDAELDRDTPLPLTRHYERFPYVPADPAGRDERCAEVYEIQVQGLATRLKATGLKRLVIGVSGGIDSTQALLVCAQAMDRLDYPRSDILAYTMPGFATSARTLAQARRLMAAIKCTAHEMDIRPSALQMLRDIGHPYSEGHEQYDVTFENVQAGERTSHLFRLANHHNAIVVGTGDLSELALGWCTYGVGDHMSHYAVNASVPKTLIQHVIRWVAETHRFGPEASAAMLEILATQISPELVPSRAGSNEPDQDTESFIGPYELQDFNLYYTVRFGYPPPKIAFLEWTAWRDRSVGPWPGIPEDKRHQYSLAQIKEHLRLFLFRFFKTSQFKRSCIPNAPKVGSGGSLSPRGDWRAPSDSEPTAWLETLNLIPDGE
ncbi:MAG TPA: NAD(+) synthase [Candidatus Binataceae bacterium]|nr:NAD(+) synthase [Candidatus Binataceae bacterium]